jgi:hypothetical protein
MTKKLSYFVLCILLFSVLSLVGCSLDRTQRQAAVANPINETINITLAVNNGTSTDNFAEKIKPGISVFELMKTLSDNGKIEFKYQESGAGVFIDEINGIANDGAKNMYWMLYVNDKLAEAGASDLKLKAGDIAEWKYIDTTDLYK